MKKKERCINLRYRLFETISLMKLFLGRNVTFITINVVNIIFLSTGKQRRLPSFDKINQRTLQCNSQKPNNWNNVYQITIQSMYMQFKITHSDHIGGVIVIVFASSTVDRVFEPRSGQTKVYKIGICCFSDVGLRRKSKYWLARNQNNLSEWSDMSTHRLFLLIWR